jgi:hypothetical protein
VGGARTRFFLPQFGCCLILSSASWICGFFFSLAVVATATVWLLAFFDCVPRGDNLLVGSVGWWLSLSSAAARPRDNLVVGSVVGDVIFSGGGGNHGLVVVSFFLRLRRDGETIWLLDQWLFLHSSGGGDGDSLVVGFL